MTKKERDELSDIVTRIDTSLNGTPTGSLSVLNIVGELHSKVKELIKSYDERTS